MEQVHKAEPQQPTAELIELRSSYQALCKKYFPDRKDVPTYEVEAVAHATVSRALVGAWRKSNLEGAIEGVVETSGAAAKLNMLLNVNLLPSPDGKFIPVLEYLKKRYQQLIGPDTAITYEVAEKEDCGPDLPSRVAKNMDVYSQQKMGVRCLRVVNGDRSLLIPIVNDFAQILDDATKGMFTFRLNSDGSLAGGGILVKELSQVPQDAIFDYISTLVHEIDHAVFYGFNRTIHQIDDAELVTAQAVLLDAIKDQVAIDQATFPGDTQEERDRNKADARSKLRTLAESAEMIVQDKESEKTMRQQKLARDMRPIVAEGMAKRAEAYLCESLGRAVPEIGDELRFITQFDTQQNECSPGMLLYAAGKRYVDRVLPMGNEGPAYLTGAIDKSIVNRTGNITPNEMGHQILAELSMKRKFFGGELHMNSGEVTSRAIANHLLEQQMDLVIQFFGEGTDKAFDLALKVAAMPAEKIISLYAEQEAKVDLKIAQEIVSGQTGTNLVSGTPEWKRRVLEAHFSAQAIKSLRESIIQTLDKLAN